MSKEEKKKLCPCPTPEICGSPGMETCCKCNNKLDMSKQETKKGCGHTDEDRTTAVVGNVVVHTCPDCHRLVDGPAMPICTKQNIANHKCHPDSCTQVSHLAPTSLKERLAAIIHEQWAHWTWYMLDNLTDENIKRWRKQIDLPYSALSEKEKDSDRTFVDAYLAIVEEREGFQMEKCEDDCANVTIAERQRIKEALEKVDFNKMVRGAVKSAIDAHGRIEINSVSKRLHRNLREIVFNTIDA